MNIKLGQSVSILSLLLICILSSCQTEKSGLIQNDSQNFIEQKIDSLISKMSLEEKIGQTAQRGTSSRGSGVSEELKQLVRDGLVGSLLNINSAENTLELQRIAIEESPNGIPIIFARDVIHGFHTIFPIPLGQAATWNADIVEKGARIAAKEATATGIRWTFAPMLDIARDPRWGRIAESLGEDPYLTEVLGKAYVKGFQTDDLSNPSAMASCAKHFVGYGAAVGGRDYNSAIIHDELLHNVYLRPFKAAIDQGAATIMTSFNELNGVPASGNKYILKDVLRDQWQFDGFVVSDWNSITEMIDHGYSPNEKQAAYSAASAGLDMEMTSGAYEHNLKELIEEGKIPESELNAMVRNILRIKFRMGLFDRPYFEPDEEASYKPVYLQAAKEAAKQSVVLLKNDQILPLDEHTKKIAIIGPLADQQREQLGTWIFDGEEEHSITPLKALRAEFGNENVNFASGLKYSRDRDTSGFKAAVKAAKNSDVILVFAGEEAILSGEAHSRANIDLPGEQEALITVLKEKTNKPIVLVILAGRPITLGNIIDKVDAVMFAWHPGTMGGEAISDLLVGKSSPSGRLPVSWPKSVGQIPYYYNHKNTGRPASDEEFVAIDDIPIGAWQSSLGNDSHYLDDGFKPMYPFGYGLTYTKFEYKDLSITKNKLEVGDSLEVKVKINNLGQAAGTEVVQLYIQDKFGSITRPVRELIDFKKVTLKPNTTQEVSFIISTDQLKFYNQNQKWVVEPGDFNLWVAPNALEGLSTSFEVIQ